MDAITSLFTGPRAEQAFVLRSVMSPPWSLRIEDRAPLTVVTPIAGETWVMPDGERPFALATGDVAVLRGPGSYTVADSPGTEPQVVILPGQQCTYPSGEAVAGMMDLGVRTWGNSVAGTTVLLTGTYGVSGEVSERLLHALPDHLVIAAGPGNRAVLSMLSEEAAGSGPGQSTVLDRLLDLLVITTLRSWLDRSVDPELRWYRGYDDPVIGASLRLIHNEPAMHHTVQSLAAVCNTSRATFARRFADIVGEPPLAYLTAWRLALAADLLHGSDATIGAIAEQVGYGSAFALSAAFSRERGESPSHYRRAAARLV